MQLSNHTLQVHIKTETFSSVSGVNIDDVFSATHDDYLVLVSIETTSGSTNISSRLRASGVANSSANYKRAVSESNTTGVISRYSANSTQFSWAGQSTESGAKRISLTFFDPFKALPTGVAITGYTTALSGQIRGFSGGGEHTVSTSFDGISLSSSSGSMTGRVEIYGAKK